MLASRVFFRALHYCFRTLGNVMIDFGILIGPGFRSRTQLAAENLFLRKQLALFQERKIKPRRADDSTRWVVATSQLVFCVARRADERETRYSDPVGEVPEGRRAPARA